MRAGSNVGAWDILVAKAHRLCSGSDKTKEKGLVLALDDIPAITADLDALMSSRIDAFHKRYCTNITNLREHKTRLYITALRSRVCDPAMKAENEKLHQMRRVPGGMLPAPATHMTAAQMTQALTDAYNKAWEPYSPYYDEEKIMESQRKYSTELLAFNNVELPVLAEAHVKWMDSRGMKDQMRYHFDKKNPYSGLVHMAVVSRCVGASQQMLECKAYYAKMLDGDVSDEDNYIAQTLLGYQKTEIDLATKFTNGAGGKNFVQQMEFWNELVKSAEPAMKIVGDALEQKDVILGRLLTQFSGVLLDKYTDYAYARFYAGGANPANMPRWMGLLSTIRQQPLPTIYISRTPNLGDRLNFAGEILQSTIARVESNLGTAAPKMDKGFKLQFKTENEGFADVMRARNAVHGAHSNQNAQMALPYPFDPAVYEAEFKNEIGKRRNKTVPPTEDQLRDARRKALIKAMKQPLEVDRGKAAAGARKVYNVANNTLNVILQAAALFHVLGEDSKETGKTAELQTQSAKDIVSLKYLQFGAGLLSSVAEFVGSRLDKLVNSGVQLARGGFYRVAANIVKGFGRMLGVIAGAVAAFLDFKSFKKAKEEGKRGLATAHVVAFGVSSASLAIILTAPPIAFVVGLIKGPAAAAVVLGVAAAAVLVLALVGIVVAVWVMKAEQKANIQEWLSRTLFGKNRSAKFAIYSTLEVEEEALKGVLS